MGRFLKHFIYGMGGVMDLGGTRANSIHVTRREIKLGSPEDDARALAGDWERVGNDLRNAMLSQHVQEAASAAK